MGWEVREVHAAGSTLCSMMKRESRQWYVADVGVAATAAQPPGPMG